MSESSMQLLAARLARGEEAAFAELYDVCADRLHRYLSVRLGCPESASDVLQTAFLRAVRSRRRFRGVENPVAYVFQIARNEAARAMQSGRTVPLSEGDDFEAAGPDIAAQDDAEIAAAALAKLDESAREIVELKIYGKFTFHEISELMQLPQGTVATRYRRALESLRGWLTKQLR